MWKQPCDGGSKQCWFTLFFAAGARQLFPCFDEPSAKARFSVRVARTAGWATLFNTPLLRSEPLAGGEEEGWVWDVFEETPVMSTYLLALAIQDRAGNEPSRSLKFLRIYANQPTRSL